MRIPILLLAFAVCASAADDRAQVIAVVNKLFEGMAASDAAGIAAVFTPGAKIIAADAAKIAPARPAAEFAERIGAGKNRIVERMWKPTVLIRGRIAMLWADYDVYVGGKFGHCGIDAFMLLNTDSGWKISQIEYTSETEHCTAPPTVP